MTCSLSARSTRFSTAVRVAPRICSTGARSYLTRPRMGLSMCRSAAWRSFTGDTVLWGSKAFQDSTAGTGVPLLFRKTLRSMLETCFYLGIH